MQDAVQELKPERPIAVGCLESQGRVFVQPDNGFVVRNSNGRTAQVSDADLVAHAEGVSQTDRLPLLGARPLDLHPPLDGNRFGYPRVASSGGLHLPRRPEAQDDKDECQPVETRERSWNSTAPPLSAGAGLPADRSRISVT